MSELLHRFFLRRGVRACPAVAGALGNDPLVHSRDGAGAERVGCQFTASMKAVFGTFHDVPSRRDGRPFCPPRNFVNCSTCLIESSRTGLPFSVWSVSKLAEHCRRRRLLPAVTHEWGRRLLRWEGHTANCPQLLKFRDARLTSVSDPRRLHRWLILGQRLRASRSISSRRNQS